MSSSDDLSSLLVNPRPPRQSNPANQSFRQATVLTFDPATGANSVLLAGAVLTNLPLMNLGDTVNLIGTSPGYNPALPAVRPTNWPGDAVLIGKLNNAMFILGRTIPTPSAEALTNVAVFTTGASPATPGGGFALTTTVNQVVCSATIAVPAWANFCAAIVVGNGQAVNSTGASDYLTATVAINGTSGPACLQQVEPTKLGFIGASAHREFSVTPGGTITVSGEVWTFVAPWATNSRNAFSVTAQATFTKV